MPITEYVHTHKQGLRVHLLCLFFFQAEDGIRDLTVTGVQTCALPILRMCSLDIFRLCALAAATQQQDQCVTVLPVIHPVSRAEIDPQLAHAAAYTLPITAQTRCESIQSGNHASARHGIA